MIKKLFVFVFCILILAGIGGGWYLYSFVSQPVSSDSKETIFEVSPGSFTKITNQLYDKGLITDKFLFKLLAKIEKKESKVRVGEFLLNTNMNPRQILNELVEGKIIQYSFTIQEGLNIYEIAQLLDSMNLADKAEFLRLSKSPTFVSSLIGPEFKSLEGFLFPETYNVTKYEGAEKIIRLMVGRFNEVYKKIMSESGHKKTLNLKKHVTLASMIEKETGAAFERPMISSVFHNRLRIGMRLQSDPTILYGIMEETSVWKKNIRKKDIRRKTAYNTYTVRALPVGPIANPGEASLRATLNPVESKKLYFVSRNDGTHYFSESLKEHNRAVRKYQLNKKAREGKSWRDLNKRSQ
ncbi:MAG: endolytic transglycosylase MltG [Bdellovibrionales bacterium]